MAKSKKLSEVFDEIDHRSEEQNYKLQKVIIGIALQGKKLRNKQMVKAIDKIQSIKLGELVRIKCNNARAYLHCSSDLHGPKLEILFLEKEQIAVYLGMESKNPNMCICRILIGNKIFWVGPLSIEEVK